jgi:hypothetical protein
MHSDRRDQPSFKFVDGANGMYRFLEKSCIGTISGGANPWLEEGRQMTVEIQMILESQSLQRGGGLRT